MRSRLAVERRRKLRTQRRHRARLCAHRGAVALLVFLLPATAMVAGSASPADARSRYYIVTEAGAGTVATREAVVGSRGA